MAMVMVKVQSTWALGRAVSLAANRGLALRCWEEVKQALGNTARGTSGLIVYHDRDRVHTSYDWLQASLIRDCEGCPLPGMRQETSRGLSRCGIAAR